MAKVNYTFEKRQKEIAKKKKKEEKQAEKRLRKPVTEGGTSTAGDANSPDPTREG